MQLIRIRSNVIIVLVLILGMTICLTGIIGSGLPVFSQEIQHEAIAINIEVPVRVFKGDTFIDNLTVDDFEVYEEGVIQTVEAVYFIRKTEIIKKEIKKEDEAIKEEAPKVRFNTFVVDGDKYKTLLTKKYLSRKPYVDGDDKKVTAFISGGIRKIYVKKGRSISVGDKLLVLEAMKMRNDIISSIDGVIKEIFVKVGDNVSKGQVLVEYK